MDPRLGQTLSHYLLLEEIGHGGMGVVYKALDTRLHRHVAIKLLPPDLTADPDRRTRFGREARALAAAEHQHIAAVHDIDEVDGLVFIVMEYVAGSTLRSLIRDGRLTLEESLRIGAEVAEALAAAHHVKVVHRDVKPDNVIIRTDGHAKVLDFGLAKLVADKASRPLAITNATTISGDVTEEGRILGTVDYMSPEQASGLDADNRSDIFSLGVTLYEMVTGKIPFHGKTIIDRLGAIIHQPAVLPSSLNGKITPKVDEILSKCLEKDPRERYQHADDLAVDLRHARGTGTNHSFSVPPARPPRRRVRWPGYAAVGAGLLALLWTLGVMSWPPWSRAMPVQGVAVLPLASEGFKAASLPQTLVPFVIAERLSVSPKLLVASFSTSREFQPRADPRDVAGQLGVNWVVQGWQEVKQDRLHVRIAVRRGADGGPIWSGHLEGDVTEVLGQIDEMARRMVTAMGGGPMPGILPGSGRDPEALRAYMEGRALLEGWDVNRNYARAAESFEKAIALDGEFGEAHALLAQALVTNYSLEKEPALMPRALAAARRALDLAPDLPESLTAMGMVELARGRSAEAAGLFERGLRAAPADDSLCRRIASAYAALDRDAEAERMYERAIALRPEFWQGYSSKGVFYLRRARLEEAKRMHRRVIDLHPDAEIGYTNLAVAHILAGEHADAIPPLEAALRIAPSFVTRNNLGFVYYTMGRFADAAREWQLAIDEGAPHTTLYTNLGEAHRQLGNTREARAAYESALEMGNEQLRVNPDDNEVRAMVSIAQAGLGRCGEAAREASRAAASGGRDPTICYYAAIALAICGDREGAIVHACNAIEGGSLADVRTNPDLKPLLDDPRIQAMLRDRANSLRP